MKRRPYHDHQPGQPWTTRQLRAVAEDWHAGASLRDIAAEVGVTNRTLRCALSNAGFDAPMQNPALMAMPPEDRHLYRRRVEKAYRLRERGVLTWAETAAEVGWPKTVAALRQAVLRYSRRLGLDNRHGWSQNGRRKLAEAARRRGAARGEAA